MPKTLLAVRIAALAPFVSAAAAPAGLGQAPPIQKVALTGEPAPDAGPGAVYAGFVGPRIDLAGKPAFHAALSGAGITSADDQAIFSAVAGSTHLVARENAPAPGTPALFTTMFNGGGFTSSLGLDEAGRVTFRGLLKGGDVCDCDFNGFPDNHSGWWSTKPGALTKLVRAGDPVPFLPGKFFDMVPGAPIVSANGAITQLLVFQSPGFGGSDQAIVSDASGSFAVVARAGDAVPGFPAGTKFHAFGRPFAGSKGDVSFFVNLLGPGIGELNDGGIWAQRGGALRLIAREGSAAPGGGSFGHPTTNSAFFNFSVRGGDKLAFAAILSGALGHGLFSDAGGTLAPVARTGDPAPGLPGVEFGGFGDFTQFGPLQLSDAGHLAFMAGLDSSFDTSESIWIAEPSGAKRMLARAGDRPPGAPAGVTFFGNPGLLVPTFGSLALNAAGQVAFDAFLAGPGLTEAQRKGLYATDPKGTLVKVAQPGDVVDVHGDGSDLRTVLTAAFNKDGLTLEHYNGPTLNDQGRLVFRLVFTDGSSGVFTSDLGPWSDLGGALPGSDGSPSLTGNGTLHGGALNTVRLTNAAPNAAVGLFASVASTPIPFGGGAFFPFPPDFSLIQTADAAGEASFSFTAPAVLPPGASVFLQYVVIDPAAPAGVAFSNGLRGVIP